MTKVVYTAEANVTGARANGHGRTSDGMLEVELRLPKEMGGEGDGTNPEQLFASGWSACFIGAMKFVGGQKKHPIPANTTVTATIGIGPRSEGGFGLTAVLDVNLPGMDKAAAKQLVDEAEKVCPYSNATRGNVETKYNVV